jgi:hypothetical protein
MPHPYRVFGAKAIPTYTVRVERRSIMSAIMLVAATAMVPGSPQGLMMVMLIGLTAFLLRRWQ